MGTRNFRPEPAPERFGQLPRARGIVFVCAHCGRPRGVSRDTLLETWGTRGVVADVARKLRCSICRKRGMHAYQAPSWAELGSPTPLDRLVATIRAFVASGRVD